MQMVSRVVHVAETTVFPRSSRASPFSALHWGTQNFVQGQLDEKIEEHGVLLNRLTKVPDLHCAWLLPLLCAASLSKLRAPGCQSCVILQKRADA